MEIAQPLTRKPSNLNDCAVRATADTSRVCAASSFPQENPTERDEIQLVVRILRRFPRIPLSLKFSKSSPALYLVLASSFTRRRM
jgi:hypothetical protein